MEWFVVFENPQDDVFAPMVEGKGKWVKYLIT